MQISVVLVEAVWSTDKKYDYKVPANLEAKIIVGQYIKVPFGLGNRKSIAFVMDIFPDQERAYKIKEILEIVDEKPVLQADQIELMDFIRFRYTCTYGNCLKLMVPSHVVSPPGKSLLWASLVDKEEAGIILENAQLDSVQQIKIVELLLEYSALPIHDIKSILSVSKSPIDTLCKKGFVEIKKIHSSSKSPYFLSSASTTEQDKDASLSCKNVELKEEQKQAVKTILQEDNSEFLLYGITGSGKTEVYLQVAEAILKQNKTVLFLVPEIALTPQMIWRVKAQFFEQVVVIHSRLSPKERYENWNLIRQGKAKVVVGARSGVFVPLPNLGLIILDEEQDTSYKSEQFPRYHVRDIARKRAAICGAKLILGSATPAIETYYSGKLGYTKVIKLENRTNQSGLPQSYLIDMSIEGKEKQFSVFSKPLKQGIRQALDQKEQIILFLNKRGYAGILLCRECGEVSCCPDCSVSMTVHSKTRANKNVLICHYCGKVQPAPEVCPSCQSKMQTFLGLGTQQLESMVEKEFPEVKILRMDQDTTSNVGGHEEILDLFRQQKAQILIGTQMIAKGHDFPNVTVVGIMAADLLLRGSDFRTSERGFNLITQASGRAGRGDKKGHVYIQTFQREDPVITAAVLQDYDRFFAWEILFRKKLQYPPFNALGSLIISHSKLETAYQQAGEVQQFIQTWTLGQGDKTYQLYDVAYDTIFRLRNNYRYRINIKTKNKSQLAYLFAAVKDEFFGKKYNIGMDIDPLW